MTAVEQSTQDKIKEVLTRAAQTDSTGVLISRCGLLEWGLSVTSATCVCQARVRANGPYCQTGSSSTRSGALIDPMESQHKEYQTVVCQGLNIKCFSIMNFEKNNPGFLSICFSFHSVSKCFPLIFVSLCFFGIEPTMFLSNPLSALLFTGTIY